MVDIMTAVVWELSKDRVLLLCDTLVSDPSDLRPVAMTTKIYVAPHLGLLVCGTGISRLVTRFYLQLIEGTVARDISHLDEFAPKILADLFSEFSLSCPPGLTGTVYTFGWSETEKCFVGFAYRSTANFSSQPLGYGIAAKPPPNDISLLSQIDNFEKVVELLHTQKAEDRAKPRMERVGIGGDIFMYLMQLDDKGASTTTVQRVERFPDFEKDWETILAKLPQNVNHPESTAILSRDP